jgi:ZIP family zinc transporter
VSDSDRVTIAMTAFLITSGTCVMTLGGGLLVLRLEAYRGFVLAFAAGALVSSALLDVIPDALDLLERSGAPLHHHYVMFACCLGFLAFYLLEQATHSGADEHDLQPSSVAGLWGATGIGVHSLLDGVAIGEAFHAGAGVGWIVAMAVIVHKFADGVSTVGILMSTGRSPRVANAVLVVTSLAPLAGLALQSFVPLPLYMLAFVLGWFAGVFLYLGAAALIPAAHATSHSRWLPAATLCGVALVFVVYRVSAE